MPQGALHTGGRRPGDKRRVRPVKRLRADARQSGSGGIGFQAGDKPDTLFTWYPNFDKLRTAGVTPSYAVGGFGIELDIRTSQQRPVDSVVSMTDGDMMPVTIATIHFM